MVAGSVAGYQVEASNYSVLTPWPLASAQTAYEGEMNLLCQHDQPQLGDRHLSMLSNPSGGSLATRGSRGNKFLKAWGEVCIVDVAPMVKPASSGEVGIQKTEVTRSQYAAFANLNTPSRFGTFSRIYKEW